MFAFFSGSAFAAAAKKAHAPKNAKNAMEARDGNEGRGGKLAGLPGAVVETVRALQGNGQIGDVTRETEDGETLFEVEIVHGAVTRTHVLDAEGVQLNVQVFPSEVPAPAMSAITTEAGGGRVEFISQSREDGQIVYEAEIIKGGKKRSATFSVAGKVISRQVSLTELPAKIQQAVAAQLNGGKLGSFFQGQDDDGDPVYFGASVRSGRARWFTVDGDGDLISEEEKIPLADAPASVRQTVAQRLGGADHVRLSRVKEDEGVKFDVLAMTGKSVTAFSVTAQGELIPAGGK